MSTYRQVFPRRNTFLVVIHVEDEQQVVRSVGVALEGGADGVFLINHRTPPAHLDACYESVREKFPDAWIGMNWLGLSQTEALHRLKKGMNGLWIDNAGASDSQGETERILGYFAAERLAKDRAEGTDFLLFGGVAFKYQEPVRDPARAARFAIPYVDIITTSGEGTGIAADTYKIRQMKEAIGEHPLAIASGITPENVTDYLDDADCFLVATGISDPETDHLVLKRVTELAKKLR